MVSSKQNWLAAPSVTGRWALGVAAITSALVIALVHSPVASVLETRVAEPVNFWVRDKLGLSPILSSQLKIYGIDDATYGQMESWYLPWATWASILEKIAAREPRAILVDTMFTKPSGTGPEQMARALGRIAKLEVPIAVGSWVSDQNLVHRPQVDLAMRDFQLKAYGVGEGIAARGNLPAMVDRRGSFLYGPVPEIQRAFGHVGHIAYGAGRLAPLIRLSDATVVPHLGLFAALERKIAGGRLRLDGRPVPVDQDGMLAVNFVPAKVFAGRVRRMQVLLDIVGTDVPARGIDKGDVVLLVPQYFTGASDFRQTPYGEQVGSFVVASAVNSVITGQWLRPIYGPEILVILAALGGAAVAVGSSSATFWLFLGLSLVLGWGGALALFALQNVLVAWPLPLAALILSSLVVFAEKSRVSDRKARLLRSALEGAVDPGELSSLLRDPGRVVLEARERVVTLMFIDVVGFSLLAENMLPRLAFEQLKKMLAQIGETIHQFGGVIDKTLGDGLLCYFGYRFDEESPTPDHAEKALRCAIKIQRDNLARNLEAATHGDPVYPLRIGMNTASCYLGDLGTSSRIDFTVVGNGVNFAKRLEGACDMHAVLMGGTTYDLVKTIGLAPEAVTQRFIRIKHHSELVEAFEYDPFHEEPDLRRTAIESFRRCANIDRAHRRWAVTDQSSVLVSCEFGDGRLVNFSNQGLSLAIGQLLAKGTRISIQLDSPGGKLRALLRSAGVGALLAEVRWGYGERGVFTHGVVLANVNEIQSQALVRCLCEVTMVQETFERDERREQEGAA